MQTAAGLVNDKDSMAVPILCIFFDLVVPCEYFCKLIYYAKLSFFTVESPTTQ